MPQSTIEELRTGFDCAFRHYATCNLWVSHCLKDSNGMLFAGKMRAFKIDHSHKQKTRRKLFFIGDGSMRIFSSLQIKLFAGLIVSFHSMLRLKSTSGEFYLFSRRVSLKNFIFPFCDGLQMLSNLARFIFQIL
jgi:hypothetical protein